jgi:hypothetical protein
MRDWITWAAIAAGIIGTALGLWAANIEVRDNLDAFMDDIRRQSWWASLAATLAAIATVLQALEKLVVR